MDLNYMVRDIIPICDLARFFSFLRTVLWRSPQTLSSRAQLKLEFAQWSRIAWKENRVSLDWKEFAWVIRVRWSWQERIAEPVRGLWEELLTVFLVAFYHWSFLNLSTLPAKRLEASSLSVPVPIVLQPASKSQQAEVLKTVECLARSLETLDSVA